MAINSINTYATGNSASSISQTNAAKKQGSDSANAATSSTASASAQDTAVIYEKSSTGNTSASNDYQTQNAALIEKLKADSDNRIEQLRGIVNQMMTQQGTKIGTADDMWKFLASGKYTVTPEVKAQAQADIADDGYWGVDKTSNRIVDFAKALSGNDPSKAKDLVDAFKKGFEEATKSWGQSLPDISKKTYDAVLKKFDEWTGSSDSDSQAK
jgi:hypothetical protein